MDEPIRRYLNDKRQPLMILAAAAAVVGLLSVGYLLFGKTDETVQATP